MSIVLGVAFVSGTFILTDAMKNTFNALADSGNSDVYVRGVEDKTAVADQTGETRTQLPLSLGDQIKAVPGVAKVDPTLQGSAILIGKNGKAAVNGGAPPLGFGWTNDPKSWTARRRSGADIVLTRSRVEKDTLYAGQAQGR